MCSLLYGLLTIKVPEDITQEVIYLANPTWLLCQAAFYEDYAEDLWRGFQFLAYNFLEVLSISCALNWNGMHLGLNVGRISLFAWNMEHFRTSSFIGAAGYHAALLFSGLTSYFCCLTTRTRLSSRLEKRVKKQRPVLWDVQESCGVPLIFRIIVSFSRWGLAYSLSMKTSFHSHMLVKLILIHTKCERRCSRTHFEKEKK